MAAAIMQGYADAAGVRQTVQTAAVKEETAGGRQLHRETVSGGNELQVFLLGGLCVRWQGRERLLSQNAAPLFVQLLELVWLSGEEGVSRQQILRDLYEGKALANAPNSINNLLLQARKRLAAEGLPAAEYIVHRKDRLLPDPSVPVVCDACRFHELIAAARRAGTDNGNMAGREGAAESNRTTDDGNSAGGGNAAVSRITAAASECAACGEQERLYAEAASLYAGRFLPRQKDIPWVDREARRLAEEYREAVIFLIQRSAEQGDGARAGELRALAMETDPEGGWESMERRCQLSVAAQEALRCSRQSFDDIASALTANRDRLSVSACVIRLEVMTGNGQPARSAARRQRQMEELRRSAQEQLRRGDVLTQDGDNALLAILVGYDGKEQARLLRRIRADLRRSEGSNAHVTMELCRYL